MGLTLDTAYGLLGLLGVIMSTAGCDSNTKKLKGEVEESIFRKLKVKRSEEGEIRK